MLASETTRSRSEMDKTLSDYVNKHFGGTSKSQEVETGLIIES